MNKAFPPVPHSPGKTIRAYLSLGSNLGDTRTNLENAVREIMALPFLTDARQSRVYLTEPQDCKNQPYFANLALGVSCPEHLGAHELFRHLREIETWMGRKRELRFGPRSIDIDLLLFGNLVLSEPELTLPHPRMCRRAFVLVPLQEIAPDLVIPGAGHIARILDGIEYEQDGSIIRQD